MTDGVHAAGFLLALSTALTTALADRYRVERELGQGGMATVYLTEDLRPHRQVALKVVREELRDHDVAVSFVGEAVVRHDVWLVQFPRLPVCDRLRKDSRAAALLDGLSKR